MLSGRVRRLPYLGYSLLLLPIVLLIVSIGASLISNARFPLLATILGIGLLTIFLSWAGFALGVKRCHDLDKSGWFYFWLVFLPGALSTTVSLELNGVTSEFGLPIIGGVAGLVAFLGGMYLLLARGTDGPNQYGIPPEAG